MTATNRKQKKASSPKRAPETLAQKRTRTRKIVALLRRYYPNVECALHHENPLQLLIATVLSAQCTDDRVNLVTPALFRRFPTVQSFAEADLAEIEALIRSTGFFKNKARHIKACCQQLVAKYAGQVPKQMEALVELPGVGRKTANVVLGVAYKIAFGVVVDTHVSRLANRLDLVRKDSPILIERELMELLPKADWIDFSHLLITHGRRVCKARKPQCEVCFLENVCPKRI